MQKCSKEYVQERIGAILFYAKAIVMNAYSERVRCHVLDMGMVNISSVGSDVNNATVMCLNVLGMQH